MKKKLSKNIEWSILVCTVLLVIIGLIALFSATQNAEYDEFKKQILWISISIPFIIVFTLLDYDTIAKISPIIYAVMIVLLVGVLFTKPINGATSWFDIKGFSLQPSEFAKIAVILFLLRQNLIMQQLFWKKLKEN